MIVLKSPREIEKMRAAGKIVAEVLERLKPLAKPGVTTEEFDSLAERIVKKYDAIAGFKGYRDYPASICTSVNEEVVHGIPGKRVLKNGDIISLDFGAVYQGMYADAALTLPVGEASAEARRLIAVAERSLREGIFKATANNRIGDISFAIQSAVEKNNYSVVRDYAGHGVGRELHEDPQIPNFGKPGTGPRIKIGMTLALEPMINMGGYQVKVLKDNWTVITADRLYSAHCEHTVWITDNGPEILTPWSWVVQE
ncbi:MAG: type I methionyl aminopeptidase [Bacillota bacterium]